MAAFDDFINALLLAQRFNVPVTLQLIQDPTTGSFAPWSGKVTLSAAPGANGVTVNKAGTSSFPNAPVIPMDFEWTRVRQLAEAAALYAAVPASAGRLGFSDGGPRLVARGPQLGMRG